MLTSQNPEEIERSTFEVDNILERARASDSDAERELLATQTLTMARSLRYDGGIIRSSMVLGDVCARSGRTEQALQYYLEAEAKIINTGNRAAQLAVQNALGDLFFQEKLYVNARRYYREILVLQPNDFRIKEKMGDACLLDMRFDSAEYFYKELILKYKEEGNNPRLVQIYQKLANAYDQNGDAGKSLYYYLPIEDLVERFGTSPERGLLYNNLGRQYAALRDFPKALEYFRKAELQCIYITCDYPEVMFANMGIALHNTGDSKQGIEYLLKAKAILASRNDKAALANLEHLMATVYFSSNDLYNALSHNNEAIRFAQETKQFTVLASAYKTAADLYHDLYDFEKAFEFYREYLNIVDSVRLEEQSRLQRLNQQRTLLAAAEGQIKFLITRQNIKDLELAQERFERERLELLNKNLELETRRSEDEVLLLTARFNVRRAELDARANELVGALLARQNVLLLDEARARLAAVQKEVLSHRDTSRASTAMIRERRTKAQVAVAVARRNIDNLRLRAPFDGIVSIRQNFNAYGGIVFGGTTMPDFRAGDTAGGGTLLAELIDTSRVEVTAKLAEQDRANVAPGQSVEIRVDASPDLTLTGTVRSVSSVASRQMFDSGGERKFDIAFDVAGHADRVRPGVSAALAISGQVYEQALSVPRAAIFDVTGQPTVYVRGANGFEPKAVKVKARTETQAIIEGLELPADVALVNPSRAAGPTRTAAPAGPQPQAPR